MRSCALGGRSSIHRGAARRDPHYSFSVVSGRPSVRCRASSRREQSPLPTLAGFECIAEDVASHDGSLSTMRRTIVGPRRKRGQRVHPYRGSLVVRRQRLGLDVVARDRNLVASSCLWAQHKTAGVSDDLTWRGRRVLWRSACPFVWLHAGRLTGRGRQSHRQRCTLGGRESRVPRRFGCLISPLWRLRRWLRLCCC
jgi:hypothetical protein